jgi:hypothetical protein
MKTPFSLLLSPFSFLLSLLLLLPGCKTVPTSPQPDPAQVAQIAAVAESVVGFGVAAVLANNPEARPQLLAVAEAIEQATAQPWAPAPNNLIALVAQAAGQFGGPYGALASLAIQGGMEFYRQFYAANINAALDKQPAFKTVLVAMAKGIRQSTGTPAATAAAPPGAVAGVDLVLRAAR